MEVFHGVILSGGVEGGKRVAHGLEAAYPFERL
jgi:hypothetical protein